MELWTKVQKKISTHYRANIQTGQVHLFTGVAVCAHCGYNLRNHKSHERHYLQCETKYISEEACPGAFLPESELEQIVIKELRKLNESLLDQQKMERQVQFEAMQTAKKRTLLFDQKRYQARLDECNTALQQMYSDKAMGLITPKDFLELSKGFQEDRERYEVLLHNCTQEIQEIEANLSKGDRRTDLLDPYIHVDHLTRSMVETLIERIEVGKRDKKTRLVPVTIYWKF